MFKTVKIDPNTYPFKKFIDDQAHLDTEELRRTIKPIIHTIPNDFSGKEHLYCDKNQLDKNGEWVDTHKDAKAKGFKSMMEMNEKNKSEQDKREKQDKEEKQKIITDQQNTIASQAQQINTMQEDLKNLHSTLKSLINSINAGKNNISQ